MCATEFFSPNYVYVILGIDSEENDRILAVLSSYEEAKQFCIDYMDDTQYFDLWIEKHQVL